MKEQYKDVDFKMNRTIEVLKTELGGIRAGRANPGVLDKITVDYYGTPTPIPQIGAVSVPDARTLQIAPWDASILKAVEKAILASDLGINPNNDGKSIRLNFPQLTEERRRDLTKQVRKIGEDSKVAIRNLRRDAIEKFKELKKKSEMTEDDLKAAEKDVQDMTDKFCKEIDSVINAKEKELLEI